MYTTQPSTIWPNYIDILEDGQQRMSVPVGREQEAIAEMVASQQRHWNAITARHDDRLVIAQGSAYSIGSPHDDPKGFGGARWPIRFFDGRVIICDSLWHMGEVPPAWREQLPDNATLREIC